MTPERKLVMLHLIGERNMNIVKRSIVIGSAELLIAGTAVEGIALTFSFKG